MWVYNSFFEIQWDGSTSEILKNHPWLPAESPPGSFWRHFGGETCLHNLRPGQGALDRRSLHQVDGFICPSAAAWCGRVSMFFFPQSESSALGGKLPFEAGISLFLGAEYEDILQKNAVWTIIAQCRKPQFRRCLTQEVTILLVGAEKASMVICHAESLPVSWESAGHATSLEVPACLHLNAFTYLISFVFPFCFASGPLSTCGSYWILDLHRFCVDTQRHQIFFGCIHTGWIL